MGDHKFVDSKGQWFIFDISYHVILTVYDHVIAIDVYLDHGLCHDRVFHHDRDLFYDHVISIVFFFYLDYFFDLVLCLHDPPTAYAILVIEIVGVSVAHFVNFDW